MISSRLGASTNAKCFDQRRRVGQHGDRPVAHISSVCAVAIGGRVSRWTEPEHTFINEVVLHQHLCKLATADDHQMPRTGLLFQLGDLFRDIPLDQPRMDAAEFIPIGP